MIYFVLGILIILIAISLIRGYSLKAIAVMAWPGIKGALIVVQVLVLIGCLTGLWRVNGTIAYFISAGLRLLPPSLFVLSAFLLTSVMSLAIGTSFGVVATAGVILMSIARAGNVALIPVAGAIMSGIYVGDRNSPAASSATLVAAVTKTDLNTNIRMMLRSAAIPLALCLVLYLALSFVFPMQEFDLNAISLLEENFVMNWICIIPAAMMLVLPLCKVKVKLAMIIDIIISFLIAIFIQHQDIWFVVKAMVMGFEPGEPALSSLLSGGGIRSMLSVCGILLLSGSFADILQGTGLLDGVYEFIGKVRNRIGRFASMLLLSGVSSMLFCNQTIGVMMVNQLSAEMYDSEKEKYMKMLDLEDSVILIAGLVPWCIASSVPLSTMGVGPKALLFSFFLWLVPIWRLVRGDKIVDTRDNKKSQKVAKK